MMGLAVHRCGIGPAAGGYVPPLDGLTTNIWAAWSTRQLLSSWTGNVIRVRRTSDSTEQDIGIVDGLLDESALTSFVGAGTGQIVTFYDQTGNGRDITLFIGTGPRIVISGSVQYLSGIPCAYYSSLGVLRTATSPGEFTMFVALQTVDAYAVFLSKAVGGGGTVYAGAWANGSAASIADGGWSATMYVNGVDSSANRDVLHDAIATGSPVIARCERAPAGSSTITPLGFDNATYHYIGYFLDGVIYTSTSEAADIEAALGAAL